MDLIIHLDTNELIHPVGAHEYFLRHLLLDTRANVNIIIFLNHVIEIS